MQLGTFCAIKKETSMDSLKELKGGVCDTSKSLYKGDGPIAKPYDSDVVEVLLERPIEESNHSTIGSDESCAENEDEDDEVEDEESDIDDEDEDEDDDDDNSSFSNGTCDDENDQLAIEPPQQKGEEERMKTVTDSKNPNLKLVLKKPNLNLVNQPIVQARTSKNQILLVTLVSNTATGPIYSTAKCSLPSTAINAAETGNRPILPTLPTYSLSKLTTVKSEEKPDQSTMKNEIKTDLNQQEIDAKTSLKGKKELQQLQKTVIESKILSEYMSDNSATKIRKSRKIIPLKDEPTNGSENSAFLAKQRERSRSCSKPRLESPLESAKLAKWPSEERINKRQNMRSQNNDFVQKHLKFLNRVQGDAEATDNSDNESSVTDSKSVVNVEINQSLSSRNILPPPKPGWDMFCWKCHVEGELIPCSKCVRSFHTKCLKSLTNKVSENWICSECTAVDNRLKGISKPRIVFSADHLNQLLQFAFKRISQLRGTEFFFSSVKEEDHPDYYKYIINPVTLESLQTKIDNQVYKCTEELAVEIKWILHNYITYFGRSAKLFSVAKSIVKVCRQEMNEIETCAECYYNANTRKDWFVEVCSKPHILLWAKLKGFPYWPAKAMGINAAAAVDVRFFGDHDRAYVPIKECFLYSEKDPNPPTKQNKRNNIAECIKEVEVHIQKIKEKFGKFIYANFRTPYDPGKEIEQLDIMIPGIMEYIRNNAKSNKPALTYKIVKTADNNLSIIKKQDTKEEAVGNQAPVKEVVGNQVPTKEVVGSKGALKETEDLNKEIKPAIEPAESTQSKMEVSERTESKVEKMETEIQNNVEEDKDVKEGHKETEKPIDVKKVEGNTYEVVSKIEEAVEAKVGSVILKRKCDNWNAISPVPSKKLKTGTPPDTSVTTASSVEKVIENESKNDQKSTEMDSESTKDEQKVKKQSSSDEAVNKTQKPKLGNNSIPPLVLLTQPYVTTTAAIAVTTVSTNFINPATKVSYVPIKPGSITADSVIGKVTAFSSPYNNLKRSATVSAVSKPVEPKKFISSAGDQTATSSATGTSNTSTSPNVEKSKSPNKLVENNASESTDSKVSDTAPEPAKEEPTNNKEVPAQKCLLIPFEEIKTEPLEASDNEDSLNKSQSAENAAPVVSEAEKEKEQAPSSTNDGNNESVAIKTEVFSDDEGNVEKMSESDSILKCVSGKSEISLNRISVKDISKLRMPSKDEQKSVNNTNRIESTNEPRKPGHRIKKTCSSKQPFSPGFSTPASKQSNIQSSIMQNNRNFNSMVCIPVNNTKLGSPAQTSTPLSTPSSQFNAVLTNTAVNSPAVSATSTATADNKSTTSGGSNVPSTPSNINPQPSSQPQIGNCSNPLSSPPNPVTQSNDKQNSPQHMLAGSVTPNLAAAITDTIVRGPPRLAPRPSGPLRSEGDYVFPSAAGPVCTTLINNAHKMTDFFRSVIEDTLSDMSNNGVLEAKVKLLEMEIEKMKFAHAQELAELKNNTDLVLCEMRKSMENEKTRLISETRKQCEMERLRAVEETKKKQWCANCGKEAQFYCCWNTSYCDYPCQQKHWSRHMNNCAQSDSYETPRTSTKMTSFSVKEKQQQNKNKEMSMARNMNPFIRGAMPVPRNPLATPVQRLVPISTAGNPRYTIHCREGSWELMPSPHHKIIPPGGLVMTEQTPKNVPHMPTSLMVESYMRNNHL